MDSEKVQVIKDWPAPTTVKKVQSFLGFANFYRRFIRNYSTLASPIISLLRGCPLSWCGLRPLKRLSRTSNGGFVLRPSSRSQTCPSPLWWRWTHQTLEWGACAFFSQALSPAERNYDVGNRELLAIKLAVEEWRHWLEGEADPFLICTDHKNLEYISPSSAGVGEGFTGACSPPPYCSLGLGEGRGGSQGHTAPS